MWTLGTCNLSHCIALVLIRKWNLNDFKLTYWKMENFGVVLVTQFSLGFFLHKTTGIFAVFILLEIKFNSSLQSFVCKFYFISNFCIEKKTRKSLAKKIIFEIYQKVLLQMKIIQGFELKTMQILEMKIIQQKCGVMSIIGYQRFVLKNSEFKNPIIK